MNRVFAAVAAAGMSCLVAGCATSYAGSNAGGLFGGVGVTRLGGTSWEIRSATNGYSRREQAQNMALYKAAVITKAMNYGYFQIYSFSIYVSSDGKENATMRMRTGDTARMPYRCDSAQFRTNCRTLSAEMTIAEYGPRIGQTPAQTEAEIAKLRAQYGAPEDVLTPPAPPAAPAAPSPGSEPKATPSKPKP